MSFYVPGMKFDVRFTFSRFPLKLQHRAVQLAAERSLGNILFPTALTCCKRGPITEFLTRDLK